MPIREEANEGSRRTARRWLWVSLALLGLTFAAPLILPFAVPIEVKLGGRWLRLEAGAIPQAQQSWIGYGPGYAAIVGQPTPVMGIHSPDPLRPVFLTKSDYHWWWYRAAGVLYSVEVFDGDRWEQASPPLLLPAVRSAGPSRSPSPKPERRYLTIPEGALTPPGRQ